MLIFCPIISGYLGRRKEETWWGMGKELAVKTELVEDVVKLIALSPLQIQSN